MKKLLIGLLYLSSCSTNQVRNLDYELRNKQGNSSEGTIGIDSENRAVLQKEVLAADELRNQQWINNSLENSLNDDYYWLKRCRVELSDERLGGNGQLVELPEIDNMKTVADVKESFGLQKNGQLIFVKKEDYLNHIKIERDYQNTLTSMLKTVRKYREECERKMGAARLKAGLPAARYQGRFTLTENGAIASTVEENEKSLDDAFRIKASLEKKGKKE